MKPTMPAVPAPNLLPVGEDDASQLRHSKLLKSELKKVNPNKRTVRELRGHFHFEGKKLLKVWVLCKMCCPPMQHLSILKR